MSTDFYKHNQSQQDFILTRLIIVRMYLEQGRTEEALETLKDVIHDISKE